MTKMDEQEDFFLPVFEQVGENGTHVAIESDIRYFQERLFEVLKIPKEYLEYPSKLK